MEKLHVFTDYRDLEKCLKESHMPGEPLLRGVWQIKKNRIMAVRWLVEEKLRDNPNNLTKETFYNNDLGGLLSWYGNSPYHAALEAGYPVHWKIMGVHRWPSIRELKQERRNERRHQAERAKDVREELLVLLHEKLRDVPPKDMLMLRIRF